MAGITKTFQNVSDIRQGCETFKAEKSAQQLAEIAGKHGLETATLQTFVDGIMQRMIFDGEHLTNLLPRSGSTGKREGENSSP